MKKVDAIKIFCNTFLGEMDEDLCRMLESVTNVVSKKKGEIFFVEDEVGSNVYFLISGLIKLYKTNKEGKEAIIHFVKNGEIFAEILFFFIIDILLLLWQLRIVLLLLLMPER